MMSNTKKYSIVSFFPPELTNKSVFMFYGGKFTETERANYILWFVTKSGKFIDGWKLDADLDDCRELRKEDRMIDWNTCPRDEYKILKSKGVLGAEPTAPELIELSEEFT